MPINRATQVLKIINLIILGDDMQLYGSIGTVIFYLFMYASVTYHPYEFLVHKIVLLYFPYIMCRSTQRARGATHTSHTALQQTKVKQGQYHCADGEVLAIG